MVGRGIGFVSGNKENRYNIRRFYVNSFLCFMLLDMAWYPTSMWTYEYSEKLGTPRGALGLKA